jgi:hypothetical protein
VHGNLVTGEDDDGDYAGEANTEENNERICLTSSEVRLVAVRRDKEEIDGWKTQVLFSADDGEEDADELRSIRS